MQPIDLLAIAAHPDDVELACAGIMLVAKKLGKRTGILDLTRGELSTRGTPALRLKETEAASAVMGLDWRANLEIPDGNIELNQDNILKIVRAIRETRPTMMITPHFNERHPDHEHAAKLAKEAAFYAGLQKIQTVDNNKQPQTPHRPSLVMQYMQTYSFEPSVIIDVSSVFQDRMKAVTAYESQFGVSKAGKRITAAHEPETFLTQSGFYEWIEGRARHYGMMIGAEFAEPFWTYEAVGTRDPFALVTKLVA